MRVRFSGEHTQRVYEITYPEKQDVSLNGDDDCNNHNNIDIQDLDSQFGEFYVGSMHSQVHSPASNHDNELGFLPLQANRTVHCLVFNATIATLWDKRDINDMVGIHNFNKY
jgi:hypothetical protein